MRDYVFLSRNSVCLGIAHCKVRNGAERKRTKRNSKIKMFLKVIQAFFFVLEWFGASFQKFFFPLMVSNKIPSVFLFCEMVWNRILSIFIFLWNGSERNYKVPSNFLFHKMAKWLGTEFRAFLSSSEWFGTKLRSSK
jgi:hypothetical protein